MTADHKDQTLSRRIAVKRFVAGVVLWLEALLPKLLVPVSIALIFVALSWFGLFRIVPDGLRMVLAALFIFAFLASFLLIRNLKWPDRAAIDRRLEAVNDLPHQAVSVQDDAPKNADAFASALWREHRARMARQIKTLDAGLPGPDIARHDPYALRAVPVLMVVIAFAFSYTPIAGTLSDALFYAQPKETGPGARIDAWITPPAYTGQAPIYLTAATGTVPEKLDVPKFSLLTVRLSGGSGEEPVQYQRAGDQQVVAIEADGAEPADRNSKSATETAARSHVLKLNTDGTLKVAGRAWSFHLLDDQKPTIAFDGKPRRSANGSLEIGFKGHDDYGLKEARAIIEPVDEPKDAEPLYPLPDYRLDLPGRNTKDVKGIASRNLTEHPLSGKRVRITLVTRDAAGQEGRSQPLDMVLPARDFSEPLAASVAEQRQVFTLDERQIGRALDLADAAMIRPEETIPNLGHFLALQSARSRLALARTEDDLRKTSDYFWEIALGLEDGEVSLAERKLRDAQKALTDALERNAPDSEIQKLMADLRKAMDEYMKALAEQQQKNQSPNQNAKTAGKMLRQEDLQKMMDQIENLARSGNREEAQRLLNEMQRMMNNLQAQRKPQQNQNSDNSSNEQIEKLGKLLHDQQKLMDETYRMEQALRDRMQRGDPNFGEDDLMPQDPGQQPQDPQQGEEQQGQQDQNQADKGEPNLDQMSEDELREAMKQLQSRQEELRKGVGELTDALKERGLKPGKGFGEAKREMKDAGDSLGKARGEPAISSQGKALEALRDGTRDLMQQMMGQGQGPGNQTGQNLDPLGRQQRSAGNLNDEAVKVPDEIDIQKAREILESIRKKLDANPGAGIERQYLERLLDLQ